MAATATASRVVQGAIVFTDLVGFTEFTALSGDEAALALLAAQDRVVSETLPDDAWIVKELGDGLLLFFPDAVAAVRTCEVMVETYSEFGYELVELPRASVAERADFVTAAISGALPAQR